jgi:nucleoside phosphorylase
MAAKTCRLHDDYTVGWICALPLEMAAAKVMLDEIHEDLPVQPSDHNEYILGKIGDHNTVIVCLPSGTYGIASASTVATQLISSFRSIRFALMVGIGSGIPNKNVDIRLGDVVVSKPSDLYGGVAQYDYGKALSGGEYQRNGMLSRPPQTLLTALSKLQANNLTNGSRVTDLIAEAQQKHPRQASSFARPAQDVLYVPDYHHVETRSETCAACDPTKVMLRVSRDPDDPLVHYGLIASVNQLVRDSQVRDRLGRDSGAYCVETEAAGLMNAYPCVVVRGICDYADSHRNGDWQGYASVAAAAYAKVLLLCISISHLRQSQTSWDIVSNVGMLLFFNRHRKGLSNWILTVI